MNPTPRSRYTATSHGAHQMQPTWTGFIHTTYDALIILEACLTGLLHHVPRRPHDRERSRLITSGNVFVYEENASGIKRWTDGMTWSPSRIMGNFLVYRELNPSHHTSGEKKIARKRKRSDKSSDDSAMPSPHYPSVSVEEDRRLVGSLVDSYGFKPNGLVKRTLTVQYQHVVHHIISYYSTKDIKEGRFGRPTFSEELQDVIPRLELLQGGFKAPIHEIEETNTLQVVAPQPSYTTEYTYMQPPTGPTFILQPSPVSASFPPQSPSMPLTHAHVDAYQPSVPQPTYCEMPIEYHIGSSNSASTVSTTPSASPLLRHPLVTRRASYAAIHDVVPHPVDLIHRTYSHPGVISDAGVEKWSLQAKRLRMHEPRAVSTGADEAEIYAFEPSVYNGHIFDSDQVIYPTCELDFSPLADGTPSSDECGIPYTTAADLQFKEGIFLHKRNVETLAMEAPPYFAHSTFESLRALHAHQPDDCENIDAEFGYHDVRAMAPLSTGGLY